MNFVACIIVKKKESATPKSVLKGVGRELTLLPPISTVEIIVLMWLNTIHVKIDHKCLKKYAVFF